MSRDLIGAVKAGMSEREGSETRSEGPRTRSEPKDIHETCRRLMDALELPIPSYIENVLKETKGAVAAKQPRLSTEDWGRFIEHVDRGMGVDSESQSATPPPSEQARAQRVATALFLAGWYGQADPKDPLAPIPGDDAAEVVGFAVEAFFAWRRKLESLSPSGGVVSEEARRLAYMEACVAMETNLARSPIFSGARGSGHEQLSLLPVGRLYGRSFNVLEPKGPLTVQDAALLAHLIKSYVEDGLPSHRRVRVTLSEAARASGYSGSGGRQRQLVRRTFARMRSTTYQNRVRLPDGTVKSLTWGLMDWAATYAPPREPGRALVTLSEPLVALIRAGSLVYLEDAVLDELVRRDEYAARLWIFLESEGLTSPRDYLLFSAPEGQPERDRDTPAIADLLRLDWSRRRKVKDRIAEASRVISEVDPSYTLSVEKAQGKGMWKLRARKAAPGTPKGTGGYLKGPRERFPQPWADHEGDLGNASPSPWQCSGTAKAVPSTGPGSDEPTVPPGAQMGTPRGADGYSQGRSTLTLRSKTRGFGSSAVGFTVGFTVDSGENTCSARAAHVSDKVSSSSGFDFLHRQLGGGPFGATVEELRNPDSDWSGVLSRAASRFREWIPLYFPETDPTHSGETEEIVRDLLRCMVGGLRERNPQSPLRYLSYVVDKAKTPAQLLVEDYELASLKARQKAKKASKPPGAREVGDDPPRTPSPTGGHSGSNPVRVLGDMGAVPEAPRPPVHGRPAGTGVGISNPSHAQRSRARVAVEAGGGSAT